MRYNLSSTKTSYESKTLMTQLNYTSFNQGRQTSYQNFLSTLAEICGNIPVRHSSLSCFGSSSCNNANSDPNSYAANPKIRDEQNDRVKALGLSCLSLFSKHADFVGGPAPWFINTKNDYQDLIQHQIEPLNTELAAALTELANSQQTVIRDDLPQTQNPSCGPVSCPNHPKETWISQQTANNFISTAQNLIDSASKTASQETTTSSSSTLATTGCIIVSIAVLGIATAQIYSYLKKQSSEKHK